VDFDHPGHGPSPGCSAPTTPTGGCSKGAGALLARLATARHSKDVDVFFNATDADVDDALDALRLAGTTTPSRRAVSASGYDVASTISPA
jgi:hypothetical protein